MKTLETQLRLLHMLWAEAEAEAEAEDTPLFLGGFEFCPQSSRRKKEKLKAVEVEQLSLLLF